MIPSIKDCKQCGIRAAWNKQAETITELQARGHELDKSLSESLTEQGKLQEANRLACTARDAALHAYRGARSDKEAAEDKVRELETEKEQLLLQREYAENSQRVLASKLEELKRDHTKLQENLDFELKRRMDAENARRVCASQLDEERKHRQEAWAKLNQAAYDRDAYMSKYQNERAKRREAEDKRDELRAHIAATRNRQQHAADERAAVRTAHDLSMKERYEAQLAEVNEHHDRVLQGIRDRMDAEFRRQVSYFMGYGTE